MEIELPNTFISKHLMSDGMLASYRAMTAEYDWFLHLAYVENLQNYRANGLRPGNPESVGGEPLKAPPAAFRDALIGLGRSPSNILCIRPPDSQSWKPTRPIAKFLLAFKKEKLPRIVSIDWSYPECITLAEQLYEQQPDRNVGDIFVEVARRLGSFGVYGLVPAPVLRVWTRSASIDNPAAWPMLAAARDSDLQSIDA